MGAPLSPLAKWMDEQVGKGRRFRSYRQWSIRAELNPNRASQVAEQGTAWPETLRKLAKAAKTDPALLYQLAGITQEAPTTSDLTPDEWELLQDLRALREAEPVVYEIVTEPIRRLRERLAESDEYRDRPE